MVTKRRPGRPPKNPTKQDFLVYGAVKKVASTPLTPGVSTERGAAVPAAAAAAAAVAAAAAPKATDSKAERQPAEKNDSEALDEGGRSHKRARTEEKTEDEQSPKALSTRMQL